MFRNVLASKLQVKQQAVITNKEKLFCKLFLLYMLLRPNVQHFLCNIYYLEQS